MSEGSNPKKPKKFQFELFAIVLFLALTIIPPLLVEVKYKISNFSSSTVAQALGSEPMRDNTTGIFIFFVYVAMVLFSVFTLIKTSIGQKGHSLLKLLVIIPVCFVISWFVVGKRSLKIYKESMEAYLIESCESADTIASIPYSSSPSSYNIPILLDKYIVIWNDNKVLPRAYTYKGMAYENGDKFDDALECYDKALKAYEKYDPDDMSMISFVHMRAAVIESYKDNNDMALQHSRAACEYYKDHMNDEPAGNVGMAFLWVANSYYNIGQYEDAKEYIEIGAPYFYDSIDWGFGDETAVTVMAVYYRLAIKTYTHLNDQENLDKYKQLYDDFVWFRDINESDLDHYIDYFHWMKD